MTKRAAQNTMNRITTFLVPLAACAVFTACSREEPAAFSRMEDASSAPAKDPHSVPAPTKSPMAAKPLDSKAAPAMGAGAPFAGVPAPPPIKVEMTSTSLVAAGLNIVIPETWSPAKPENSMRLAQYSIPGEAGPAELVVFYFGPGQGGSIESNVQRWAGQFSADKDTTGPITPEVASLEHDGLRVALVRTKGTYTASSMMPGAPKAEPKPGYALFGVVVEGGPEGSVFLKATGPAKTLDAQAANFEFLAKSVKPTGK
ncbi:MAG: hypothetical protein K1X53_16000 [Candidatus Sumerlaeaceae bacterium]|nr:hypothetical protein [Candidatus Sumerlaeaceae bacterium]